MARAFEALYGSPWHHPGAAWIGGLLVLIAIVRARAELRWLLVLLELEIVVDALFTGAFSPVAPNSMASTLLSVLFVILGDLRFFYVLGRQRLERARALPLALGAALVVPVLTQIARRTSPDFFAEPRHTFLFYELAFVLVALVTLGVVRRTFAPGPIRRWLLLLTGFEVVQYGLWVLADVVILAGADAGFGLRLVPNLMYYVAFVPFVFATAPGEARA